MPVVGNGSIVAVGGRYATGGSAARDFFRDQPSFAVFPNEFRILKDEGGLLGFRQSLSTTRSAENSDMAARRFEEIFTKYGRAGRIRKLQIPGNSYDKFTGGTFSRASREFLDGLTAYTYPMDSFLYDLEKSRLAFLLSIFRKMVLKQSVEQLARMIFFDPDDFDRLAQQYLESVFLSMRSFLEKPPDSTLVLHNLLSHNSVEEAHAARSLIPSLKVVIVERDPRDVFLDIPHRRYLPPGTVSSRAQAFVRFHKYLRQDSNQLDEQPWVTTVSFENLVLNTRETLAGLAKFLGPEGNEVPYKVGPHFDPRASAASVGLWKRAKAPEVRDAVDFIGRELGCLS